jgi:hypothetical protein
MTVGGVVSTTRTVWLQVAELLQVSVACQVRVAIKVVPQEPALLVTVPINWTVTLLPPQLLKAVGGSKIQELPHSTFLLPAQVRATPPRLVIVNIFPATRKDPVRAPGLGFGKVE